ncbi:MAG: type II toxin-antitoxin system VapC family toxin [Spirochaetales bacterium]
MTAVLDVSAAIDILLQKEKKELFNATYEKASWVIAPDLYIAEISNVLWKYYKSGLISHMECIQYVEDGIELIDDYFPSKELWKEALGEGIKNTHSIYDIYYAVLARRNDATLITNDSKLSLICNKLNIEVKI